MTNKNNTVYAAGDLGVDNLITIVIPSTRPIIIDGKGLKSSNRYYNKEIAKLQSEKEKVKGGEKEKIKKHINRLYHKRDKQFNHYLNTASNRIVEYLQGKGVQEFIIGWNDSFKQQVNMIKKNNQNFVQVPHARFRDLLKRKCEEVGIVFTVQEESYTSKASCMDHDNIPVYDPDNPVKYKFSGYRIKRGLYKSKVLQEFIHADVNGAWNILYKSKPSIRWSSREIAFPEKLKIIF